MILPIILLSKHALGYVVDGISEDQCFKGTIKALNAEDENNAVRINTT